MGRIDLLCLGTGKASTHIYHGEPSTGFVVIQDGEPVLLLGAGLGIVRSCIHYCQKIPDTIYISHNHSDHAGELPLLLSVEAGKGRRKRVVAEPEVMNRLLNNRLAEYHESINLSNRRLSDLAEFVESPEGEVTHVTSHLSLIPHRSQHSERCYGFLLFYLDQQIMGWSADSGYDPQFYSKISSAPVLVLDARQTSSYDHAGFDNVITYERELALAADARGEQRIAVYVSTYGTQEEMPTLPQALRIGQTLVLNDDGQYTEAAPKAQAMHPTSPRNISSQPRPRQPIAPPQPPSQSPGGRSELRVDSHQRSTEIKNFLKKINETGESHDEEESRSYLYQLPGQVSRYSSSASGTIQTKQRSSSLHQIKKFPPPAPGPRKIFVHNNECKGAPPRMFLIKSVRTLEQLKLKVADTLNIKPIKHLHRVDGTAVKSLEELSHMMELVATKHAGAPFDIRDLPIHVKVGGLEH